MGCALRVGGAAGASAALPLLDEAQRHRLCRVASHLPPRGARNASRRRFHSNSRTGSREAALDCCSVSVENNDPCRKGENACVTRIILTKTLKSTWLWVG